jgi:PAS domain S-box-containing protein
MERGCAMKNQGILIVEDEAIIALNIKADLEMRGYNVVKVVANGPDAVHAADEYSPDLILADIMIDGEMDGIDAVIEIQKNHDIPVIYLTAHSEEHTLQRAKSTRPYGYILKPVNLNELYSSIDIALYKYTMEQRLIESEKRYRNLIESVNDVIYATDDSGIITYVSPQIEELTGYKVTDVVGKEYSDFICDEDRENSMKHFQKIRGASAIRAGEYRIIIKDGSLRWVQASSRPVFSDGTFNGMRGVLTDVTDKKNAEESLKVFKAIIENSNESIAVCNNNGTLVYFNAAFERLFDVKPDDAKNKNIRELYQPESISVFDDIILPALDKGSSWEGVLECHDTTGRKFQLWERVDSIRDARGRTQMMFGIMHDVTAQQRAGEQMRMTQFSVDNFLDEVYWVDREGRFIYVNDTACRALGYQSDEFNTITIFDVDTFVTPDRWVTWWQTLKETGAAVIHSRNRTKGGRQYPVEVSIKYLEYKDEEYIVAYVRDITERKQFEEAIKRKSDELEAANEELQATIEELEATSEEFEAQNCELIEAQERLRGNEEQLKYALEASHDGLWDLNIDTGKTFFSDRYYSMAGYTAGEFPMNYDNWKMRVHPDDISWVEDAFNAHIEGKTGQFRVEYRFKRKDRSWMWILARGKVIERNENARPIRMIGTHVDITEQKETEQRLRESEERFRVLHQASFGGIGIHDRGVILEANHALAEMSGYAYDELVGMNGLSLVAEEWRDSVMANIISNYEKPYVVEGLKKDGTVFPMEIHGKVVPYKGNIVRVTEFRDITERNRFEKAIKTNEERLGVLIELHQMVEYSEKEIVQFALEKAISFTESRIGYMHFLHDDQVNLELFAWGGEDIHQCQSGTALHYPLANAGIWADCVKTGEPVIHNDFPNEKGKKGLPEGHLEIIRHMSVPIYDGGKIVSVVGMGNKADTYSDNDVQQVKLFAHDMWGILQRKRKDEEIKASLHEKELLLKEIHHRVKNNMQVISSLLNLQASRIKDEGDRKLFTDSQSRVRSMALVHEKLYQSKDLACIDMNDFIRNLIGDISGTYSPVSGKAAVTIQTDDLYIGIDRAIPCALIINELVSNAIKYAFPDSQKGNVFVIFRFAEGNYVLSVRDDGAGIPENIDFTKSETLGLQLVNALTSQLFGEISLDRSQGTAFTIIFPAE